jgi:hypothetical protein
METYYRIVFAVGKVVSVLIAVFWCCVSVWVFGLYLINHDAEKLHRFLPGGLLITGGSIIGVLVVLTLEQVVLAKISESSRSINDPRKRLNL